MLFVSRKYRFFYVKIAKCGSTFLMDCFNKEEARMENIHYQIFAPKWLEKSGQASAMLLYPGYFVFAFVRNPFDRFLSFFLHGLRAVRVIKRGTFFSTSRSLTVRKEIF